MRIFVTTEFCSGVKKLVSDGLTDVVHHLRTQIIYLANDWQMKKVDHDHRLTDSEFRELHVAGDVLLLYKKEYSSDTNEDIVTLSLKLVKISDHKELKRVAKKKFDYREITVDELLNITSSIDLSNSFQNEYINDFLETISDYSGEYLDNGYLLLNDYYIDSHYLHGIYDYISYEDGSVLDTVDFIIDLDIYAKHGIAELDTYIYDFASIISDDLEMQKGHQDV